MDILEVLTTDLMFVLVIILAVMPLLSMYATFKIGKVYLSDESRPRNRILRRMFYSGLATSVAGFYITSVCVGYIRRFFDSNTLDPIADVGSVTFALALITVFIQPLLNWLAFRQLRREVDALPLTGQTQNQIEDAKFGHERRILEQQHIEEKRRLTDR